MKTDTSLQTLQISAAFCRCGCQLLLPAPAEPQLPLPFLYSCCSCSCAAAAVPHPVGQFRVLRAGPVLIDAPAAVAGAAAGTGSQHSAFSCCFKYTLPRHVLLLVSCTRRNTVQACRRNQRSSRGVQRQRPDRATCSLQGVKQLFLLQVQQLKVSCPVGCPDTSACTQTHIHRHTRLALQRHHQMS